MGKLLTADCRQAQPIRGPTVRSRDRDALRRSDSALDGAELARPSLSLVGVRAAVVGLGAGGGTL